MNPDELKARHDAVLPGWMPLYYERPMELVRGEGYRVWDSEGNEYLDFFGGIVTTISGHAIPEISEAIKSQADKIVHSSTLYLIENQIRLAERLTELAPISGDKKVFFTVSGTEANEAALLFATRYRGSSEIVALRSSYHGRSFATMAITGQSTWSPTSHSPLDVKYLANPYKYRCPFCRDEPRCNLLCADDLRGLIEAETTGHVAAFIAEPIQGVGGFIEIPPGYFERVKEILDEYDILLISDEVQTAFGRTGDNFWGIEAHGVEPDLITMAKGLGNGLAIGGVVARGDLMDCLGANSLSTFGGNPVSTAAGNAVVDYVLNHDLQANAKRVGTILLDGLRAVASQAPIVAEVRGRGLMIAVEFVRPGTTEPDPAATVRVFDECMRGGLLVGKGGLYNNVLRMGPPLTLTEEEAREGLAVLTDAINRVAAEPF